MPGRPLAALVLGAATPLGMGVVGRWLADGNRVAAFWHAARSATPEVMRRDAALARVRPDHSLAGLAARHGFPAEAVPPPARDPALVERAAALAPDVVISAMYMDRIPAAMIAAFAGRIVNLHPSLLPAYRGATPIIDMLWDETVDRHSGMTLHAVTEGFDEGPIIDQRPVAFPASGSMQDYLPGLLDAAGAMLREALPAYLVGERPARPQPAEGASRCRVKLRNLAIDPARDTARRVAWLCRSMGQFATFAVIGSPRPIQVNRLLEVLGPPTGEGVTFGLNSADVDLADARVRLTRG